MTLGPLRFTNASGGTSDWVYPGPTIDLQSPASAGAVNGTTYLIYAEAYDRSQWEIATGVYTLSSGTFARTTIIANQLGTTAKISFSVPPQVYVFEVSSSLSGYAPLASPTFTGDPKAPTPTVGDNDTTIATTAFVTAAIAAIPATAAFPSGTLMLFQQSSAPTGWTKQTTHNDKALRVVSGTASSGGTNAFSTVMAQTVVGSHAITISEMPAHTHSYFVDTHTSSLPGSNGPAAASQTGSSDVGVATSSNGSGGSHNHTITMSIQYVDVIIASKN